MRSKAGWWMLGWLLGTLGCGGNVSTPPDGPRPASWKQNASQLAGAGANDVLWQRRLLFLDERHLLVVTQRPVAATDDGGPISFHATLQVLDATDGHSVYGPVKVAASMVASHSDIVAESAADGGFYLMLPDRVERYDPRLKLLAVRELREVGPNEHGRNGKPTQSGRRDAIPKTYAIDLMRSGGGPLLLVSESTKDYTQISGRWLSPDTLADFALPTFHRKVEDTSGARHVLIAGDGLVWNAFQRSTLQPKVMSAEERPLCAGPSGCRIEAQTPGLLLGAVYDSSRNVKPTVRNEAGNPVWNPEEDWTLLRPMTAVGARSAPVFAYNTPPGYITSFFNGLSNVYGRRGSSRIKVLDVAQKKTVANYIPEQFDKEASYPLELALSPSGKALALLSGETVMMYPVP